jgi:type I restriction enzyme S subunit
MTEPTDIKIPKIRFMGFSGEWKKGSVSSLLTERNIQFPKSEAYPLMAFIAGQGVAPKGKRYNRDFLVSDEANKKYKQTELGDFIYSSNNLETGSIGTNRYGSASISPVYSIFSPALDSDSSFIGPLLCQKTFINEMVRWRQGVVYGQWRIHESDFLKIELTFPSTKEQQTIGSYFSDLGQLIELHQRKHDKLVTLKKAMLQKMFPQAGATTPEIRFKGFSGAWVEKKLGDLIDLGSGRDYKHLLPGRIPVYGTGGYMLSVNESLSASMDAIGIGRKGTIDKPYILRAPFWTVDTLFYAIPKAENYLDFVYCIFQRIDWKQRDESTGVPSLSKVAINGASVLSTNSPEQQKIGTYFRQLDDLISKHAIQLQKLKQIKSACLEKMFV